jgi:signal transduction histidine kinase
MWLAILFSSLLLYEQHRLARSGTMLAQREHEEMVRAVEIRDSLAQIDRAGRVGEYDAEVIARFERLLSELRARTEVPETTRQLERVDERFEAYVRELRAPGGSRKGLGSYRLRTAFEDVLASTSSFIELENNQIYRMADALRREQERAMQLAVLFLGAFLVLLVAAGYKIIAIITRPLSMLASYLDGVNIEDDLPLPPPQFPASVPEVSLVARSFEQVLQRLRGYRALNVRRLLIEKRRADIIAASIADGVCLLRGEEILYANPVAERILGVRSGAKLRGETADAVRAAIVRTMPVDYVHEEDERRWHYLIHSYPISLDAIERIDHALGSDEVLERFQANRMVLFQDVTLVRESQDAKSHFIATLSHEVKTPVTSLTMATRLLKKTIDRVPDATQRSLILTCAEDVDRLRVLLEDLLTVSRFDTLTQKMEVQQVDLSKLLRHTVQSFRAQAEERGVELRAQVVGGSGRAVPMDAAKVAWALSNLVTNALRHTPRGGKVDASMDLRGEFAEVSIKDTGPGIERKRQGKIFDKFSSRYDLRVARSGGAGVGLAIAREIIVAHGGRIWVSSEPGRGAEFAFALPLKRHEGESGVGSGGSGADWADGTSRNKGDKSGATARG